MGPTAATQGAVDTYHPTDWRGKGAGRWAAEAEIAGFGARRFGRESKGQPCRIEPSFHSPVAGRVGRPPLMVKTGPLLRNRKSANGRDARERAPT